MLHHELSHGILADSRYLSVSTLSRGISNNKPLDSGIHIFHLLGLMFKYDVQTYSGSIIPGTDSLARSIVSSSSEIIVLHIDSGGGSAMSVYPLLNAIKECRDQGKQVIAVCDVCCSAAYWVATHCDFIYANSPLSMFGSIGTYTQVVNLTEYFASQGVIVKDVYASRSVNKNKGSRDANEGDYSALISELDAINDVFVDSVKQHRELSNDAYTGTVYLAGDAVANKVADLILPLSDLIKLF